MSDLCPIILSRNSVFHLTDECIVEYLKLKQIPFFIKGRQIIIENPDIALEKNIINKTHYELLKRDKILRPYFLNRHDNILKEIIINHIHTLEYCVRVEYLTKGTKYRIAKHEEMGGEYIEKEDDIEWLIA